MSDVTTETIGKTLDEGARRDAVHIALAPVIATGRLAPGQHVGLRDDGGADESEPPIGIVDPFLSGPVFAGERFWLFLYPMTITSLRHDWTHPAFTEVPPAVSDKEASEAWLREFVASEDVDLPSYEAVLAGIQGDGAQLNAEYLTFIGVTADGEIPPEFWEHVEVVTGVKIPRDQRAAYFSCDC